tara:strand:- start:3471 stop:4220 length:750 start_codon:yes stop_codon:yes gene_type:complete
MNICYIILTCQKNINNKVLWQKKYMFKNKTRDIYYISAKNDIKNNIYGWDTIDDYNSPVIKYINFFKNMNLNYDYYCFIDDDTFMNLKNLELFLKTIEKYYNNKLFIGFAPSLINNDNILIIDNEKIYIEKYKLTKSKGLSGGAGFVINNLLYHDIKNYIINENNKKKLYNLSFDKGKYYSDIFIGSIVKNFNDVTTVVSDKFHMYNHTHYNSLDLNNFISYHYVNNEKLFKFYSGTLILPYRPTMLYI